MQFQLSTNLQAELVAYDPALKALAAAEKKATAKKSKYPLGNPNDLIPTNIIPASLLQDAIDNINGNPVARRYQTFTHVVVNANNRRETRLKAILYHFEQCWYAAWFPPKGKEDEYLYGYAYAYKDNLTAKKVIPRIIKDAIEKCEYKQYGRIQFIAYAQLITKADILGGQIGYNWNKAHIPAYYRKSCDLYPIFTLFENQLKSIIPNWSDAKTIFTRLETKCIADLLVNEYYETCKSYWQSEEQRINWLPSATSLIDLIKYYDVNPDQTTLEHTCKSLNSILHIIDTPYLRKWIQAECDKAIRLYHDEATEKIIDIRRPWKKIFTLLERINTLNKIWPDCPIDYYQNNIDILIGTTNFNTYLLTKTVGAWLNEHMPVASYFTMLNKFYTEKTNQDPSETEKRWRFEEKVGIHIYQFRDLDDTISMLDNILEQVPLAPPKRWRITEFHDYVQGEAWKIKNPNFDMPQDLFPTPIKVQQQEQQWTFFQPKDTHQLAQWGQAVRNCVGNASSYADGVKKKQHFIVLCMIDGKPQFTVQLKVNTGLMSVEQIVGIANARLGDEQRASYTQVFGQALQAREKMLASA